MKGVSCVEDLMSKCNRDPVPAGLVKGQGFCSSSAVWLRKLGPGWVK